jgi:hypothetical protein
VTTRNTKLAWEIGAVVVRTMQPSGVFLWGESRP